VLKEKRSSAVKRRSVVMRVGGGAVGMRKGGRWGKRIKNPEHFTPMDARLMIERWNRYKVSESLYALNVGGNSAPPL